MGYKVFSSDECSKMLIKEKDVKKKIRFLFENKVKNIVTSNDEINTNKLGEYLFSNPQDLNKLECILHPLIKQKETDFLKQASIIREKTVFLDIPVMFVNKNFMKCDFIINLSVNKQIQKKRVMLRPKMTEKKLNNISHFHISEVDYLNILLCLWHICSSCRVGIACSGVSLIQECNTF